MQLMKLGRTLYIDWFYLHLCVPFSIFTMVVVSLSRDSSGPKNKCLFLPYCYSSVQGRSAPIAKFPLD